MKQNRVLERFWAFVWLVGKLSLHAGIAGNRCRKSMFASCDGFGLIVEIVQPGRRGDRSPIRDIRVIRG